jgi:acyl-CoA synthetase (NDP forming)
VIEVSTINELFNLAWALGSQPLPKGKRVAITTNAGERRL